MFSSCLWSGGNPRQGALTATCLYFHPRTLTNLEGQITVAVIKSKYDAENGNFFPQTSANYLENQLLGNPLKSQIFGPKSEENFAQAR